MSAKLEIVGMLAEPKRSVSRDGKQILNLSVGHTPRRRNLQTNEFEDAGDTLWVRAAFWEDEAELIGSQVRKGMRVRLEGEPTMSVREHEGKTYTNLELKRASISFLPQRAPQGGNSASSVPHVGGSSSGAQFGAQSADQWANPGQSFSSGAPF